MSCSICLDDDSSKEFYITSCNHIFHKECLLKTNTSPDYICQYFTHISCPMCRNQLSLYKTNTYKFSYNILSNDCYLLVRRILKTIKDLHLNKDYVFISGGFSTALYSKLTNKNKKFEYSDIDIYYIDYDNLYERNIKSSYFTSCDLKLNIKNIKKNYSNDYDRSTYDIIYLYPYKKHDKNIKETIDIMFTSFDLSCCKTAFTIKDDYIQFYIHEDYFLNKVNLCSHSLFRTGMRIEKYKKRGYTFEKFTECCKTTYKPAVDQFFTYGLYDLNEEDNEEYNETDNVHQNNTRMITRNENEVQNNSLNERYSETINLRIHDEDTEIDSDDEIDLENQSNSIDIEIDINIEIDDVSDTDHESENGSNNVS